MSQASLIAYVVWAFVLAPFFHQRGYYLVFCAVLLLAGGASALAYAPALWVFIDLVLWFPHKLAGRRR